MEPSFQPTRNDDPKQNQHLAFSSNKLNKTILAAIHHPIVSAALHQVEESPTEPIQVESTKNLSLFPEMQLIAASSTPTHTSSIQATQHKCHVSAKSQTKIGAKPNNGTVLVGLTQTPKSKLSAQNHKTK